MLTLISIPAFADNDLWPVHGCQRSLVDPVDKAPVKRTLQNNSLTLNTILVTHHNANHTAGVNTLRSKTGTMVFDPARESITKSFLPTRLPALISSAQHFDAAAHDDVSVIAASRQRENKFK